MTTLEAFFLGCLQGITEFFPISSSGHLKLAESLLGYTNLDQYILFDLICHLGTLLAIFIVFRQEIWNALFHNTLRLKQILLATLPLFLLIPIMEPVEHLFNQTHFLGFFFLLTALLLFMGQRHKSRPTQTTGYRDALFVGFFQLLAIFPGISRSGSTISAAWMRGWDRHDAVVFSFLIAIPAILGGCLVESLHLIFSKTIPTQVSTTQYFTGFITAFVTGYGALLILMKLAVKEGFQYFIWYCVALGILSLWYFNT